MKKLGTLLLFFTINCIIQSCCESENHCFFIDGISAKHLSIQSRTESIRKDTIRANDYGLSLATDITDDLCMAPLYLGSPLYATSCIEPLYNLQDKVRSISIISDATLSDNYQAGSELSGLFKPFNLRADCADTTSSSRNCMLDYSLSEQINTLEDALNQDMGTNLYQKSKDLQNSNYFYLFLLDTNETIVKNTHTLMMVFTFESGKVITLTTSPITLF